MVDFSAVAGVTFGHRQASLVALAKRGMLNTAMLEKVPFDYASIGVDTGLDYAVRIAAQGRKRVHDLGWVPKATLESGYASGLPFGAKATANVLYRGGKSGRFGLRVGLPEESAFNFMQQAAKAASESNSFFASNKKLLAVGAAGLTGIGSAIAAYMSYRFKNQLTNDLTEEVESKNSLEKVHQSDIIGLPERGISSEERKNTTDFGSGWDPLRNIARQLGVDFGELLQHKGFQKALQNPTRVIETLKAGSTGGAMGVDLMESVYKGQKFQFINKKIPFDPSKFVEAYPGQPNFQMQQVAARGEVAVGETIFRNIKQPEMDLAPNVYGHKRTGKYISNIYQEYVPGVTLSKVLRTADDMRSALPLKERAGIDFLKLSAEKYNLPHTSAQLKELPEQVDWYLSNLRNNLPNITKTKISEYRGTGLDKIPRGITHTDLHAQNLLLTQNIVKNDFFKEGTGFSIIDWGMSNRYLKSSMMGGSEAYTAMSLAEKSERNYLADMGQIDIFRKAVRTFSPTPMAKTIARTMGNKIVPISIPQSRRSVVAASVTDFESPWQGPMVSGPTAGEMVSPSDLDNEYRNIYGPTMGEIPLSASATSNMYMDELQTTEGLQHRGMGGISRRENTDFGSGFRGAAISGEISSRMTAGRILTHIAHDEASGFTPKIHIPWQPSPQIQYQNPTAKILDNVPLGMKLKIKGRSTGGSFNMDETLQAIRSNVPKSKVNMFINDNRSKLTPQTISDMIDR